MKSKAKFILTVVLIAFSLSSCGESPKTTEKPLEYKIAYLDGGEATARDSQKVMAYRSLLNELTSAFECKEEEIANMTRVASKSLSEDLKRNVTSLELMEGVSKAKSGEGGKVIGKGAKAYAEVLAILASFMKHPNG